MSRISGWTAHYLEQMEHNRLIRPKALYMGETNTPWVSIEQR
jgi:citrate synthase